MPSQLYEKSVKRDYAGNPKEGIGLSGWHLFKCQDCGEYFRMKLEYDSGSYPFWGASTKKCKHNNSIEIEGS